MSSSPDLDEYEAKVLAGWEEIYKRGLLTMWLLLAVRDKPKYAAEIAEFVEDNTNGTMNSDDRSLYRALRRLAQLELVEGEMRPGNRTGADRKYYELTPAGRRVLEAFLDRHIRNIYLAEGSALFDKHADPRHQASARPAQPALTHQLNTS